MRVVKDKCQKSRGTCLIIVADKAGLCHRIFSILYLYRQAMAAFGGIAPTYHIELRDYPVIVWDFHSLLVILQMMISLMISNEAPSLKICKKCGHAFLPSRKRNAF